MATSKVKGPKVKGPKVKGPERDTWYLEILSISASLLCLVAMTILLAKMDEQHTFRWHGVTLNALVSILATTAKATLMLVLAASIGQWKWMLFSEKQSPLIDFDTIESASRGPLGSVQLLWRIRTSPVLHIGALVTIVAIAFDPFVQQLIQYQPKLVYQNDTAATVPRAQRYSQGNEFTVTFHEDNADEKGFILGARGASAQADFLMQSAVLFGLSQPFDAVTQQVPFHCPSGNCNYSSFESLAVCSTCSDLSRMITSKKEDKYPMVVSLEKDGGSVYGSTVTNFSLPSGLVIDNMDGLHLDLDVASRSRTIDSYTLMTMHGTGNASQTNTMQDLDTLIWAATLLQVQPNPNNKSAVWPDYPILAEECALYYCVNTYDSMVINATLQETVSPTKAKRNPDSWQPPKPKNGTGLTEAQTLSIEFHRDRSSVNRTDLMLGNGFNLTQAAVDGISSYFQNFLATPNASMDFQSVNGYIISENYQLEYTPSAAQVLYVSKNLTNTFKALAASMSNALRSGDDEARLVSGRTGTILNFYHIQWIWILLPGLVTLFGLIHLVITVWSSSRAGVAPWKSSPLATLSRGYHVAHILDEWDSVREMEKAAKKRAVMLFPKYRTETPQNVSAESRAALKRAK